MSKTKHLQDAIANAVSRDLFRSYQTKCKDLPIGYFTIGKPEFLDLKSEDISNVNRLENWWYIKDMYSAENTRNTSMREFDKILLKSTNFRTSIQRKKYEDFIK